MNFGNFGAVTPAKTQELKERIERLSLDLARVEEQFVKGGGKGGQKINKTNNCVVLKYPPLDIVVRCQRERQRPLNRFIALRELVDRAEMKISPETSVRLREIEKIRRKKSRSAHRAKEEKNDNCEG